MAKILIVNKRDEIIGTEDKEKCHDNNGILHRGFSILIFNNKGQILLSRRSKFKRLWPLFWDNACSSHPFKDENYERTGEKRLKKELRLTCPLRLIDKFQYQAQYKNTGSENEVCALLVGEYNKKKIKPNPEEIADWKWLDVPGLQKDIENSPRKYTPWLKIGFRIYLKKKNILGEKIDKKKLNSILIKLTKTVNPAIERVLVSNVDKKFKKIVSYQISTGGKRLRPALAIISCKMLGGKLKDVLYPAASLEILHNMTLIVDDIIDNSNLRRGKPTTWAKFGKSIAECIGVNYSAAIFQTTGKSKKSALISELLAKTLKIVMGGEILDILFEKSGRENELYVVKNRYRKITEKDYFKMIGEKTASLFRTCCELGGIVAGAKKKETEALKKYGFNFGMAFQIQDDILDIFGKEKSFGKKVGKDIEERKGGNIVILLSLKELNTAGKNKLFKIIKKNRINKKDVKKAIQLIRETNSRQKAYRLGKKFVQKAKDSLDILPKNEWNTTLKKLADFILEREK
ncbi:MAG TPA: isopentenyl-diphosphate Delta-isomerase [Candidatus Nealsonbacteria bacterium]|uniref:isopentenyl-diphosphate Delta-isomerase n=1 Tax=marine sediment metagenome TaxID=412755 RepID=A0A0F9YE27_9ZZZZ|nr:isopentenyl-diphosphate Delta-isomerase [Candidatus Nealsonbacteria bacterium]HEB46712.1 isopentenyl-diphosphate Delta-isomerase [Candidatus Nealsonbacteria bacterium]